MPSGKPCGLTCSKDKNTNATLASPILISGILPITTLTRRPAVCCCHTGSCETNQAKLAATTSPTKANIDDATWASKVNPVVASMKIAVHKYKLAVAEHPAQVKEYNIRLRMTYEQKQLNSTLKSTEIKGVEKTKTPMLTTSLQDQKRCLIHAVNSEYQASFNAKFAELTPLEAARDAARVALANAANATPAVLNTLQGNLTTAQTAYTAKEKEVMGILENRDAQLVAVWNAPDQTKLMTVAKDIMADPDLKTIAMKVNLVMGAFKDISGLYTEAQKVKFIMKKQLSNAKFYTQQEAVTTLMTKIQVPNLLSLGLNKDLKKSDQSKQKA
ncbi:UNVERIFIED_CONTAM: hypothetical protein HDU68_005270 [Siphonaria sp. JEL0065]|nr:hypothetical protein HDU68_005270 [Siphonaria sp. JEL0065]